MRQIAQVVAGARAKMVVKGTPEQVADHMEQWYVEEAADGFNIMPPTLPGGLDDFVELVIPEIQRRGLFRTEYKAERCASISACRGRRAATRRARTKRRNSATNAIAVGTTRDWWRGRLFVAVWSGEPA